MARLRFMHIPKTAGSTVTLILAHQIPADQTFAFSGNIDLDLTRYRRMPRHHKERIALFIGHAPIVSGIPDADSSRIFTILRDPIDRARSFCHHVAEGKSAYLLRDFPPESFDLDRYLAIGDGALTNLQTKMLINRGEITSAAAIDTLSPSDARDLALETLLNRCSWFGLQESFDASVLLFASSMGWSTPWYTLLNAKSPETRLELEPRHLERLRELNAIDMEVYARAEPHFRARVEEAGISDEHVSSFGRANRVLSPVIRNWRRLRELIAGRKE